LSQEAIIGDRPNKLLKLQAHSLAAIKKVAKKIKNAIKMIIDNGSIF